MSRRGVVTDLGLVGQRKSIPATVGATLFADARRNICSSSSGFLLQRGQVGVNPLPGHTLSGVKLIIGGGCSCQAMSPTSIRRSPVGPSQSSGGGMGGSGPSSCAAGVSSHSSINSVSLVGVAHDIQLGYVFEESVLQFTLTTTSLQTNALVPSPPGGSASSSASHHSPGAGGTEECVVEKDHHVVRCFGEVFSQEVHQKIKEGSVLCVNGRLRLNPQLEPSVNKYYYFPYIQVQPPYGQVAVVYTDRTNPPQPTESSNANGGATDIAGAPSPSTGGG